MSKQTLINNVKQNAPKEIVTASNWLGMKKIYQDGKMRKPPTTTLGYMCNANDSSFHKSFDAIAQSVLNGKNEGFTYYLKNQNICVLCFKDYTDSDDCFRADATYVQEVLLQDSYTEYAPDKDDMYIFFKTETQHKGTRFDDGCSLVTSWYEVTGNVYPQKTVHHTQEEYDALEIHHYPLQTITDDIFNQLCWFLNQHCWGDWLYTAVCPHCQQVNEYSGIHGNFQHWDLPCDFCKVPFDYKLYRAKPKA